MARDPRQDPACGDRILLRHEGAERLVVEIRDGSVVWRWLGGSRLWKTPLFEWRRELESAKVTSYP